MEAKKELEKVFIRCTKSVKDHGARVFTGLFFSVLINSAPF